MKKIICLFIVLHFIYFIYSQESDDFVRRKIMLLPFINKSTDTKYDYLSDVIRHSLKTELNNKDIYNFAGFNEIDENTIDIKYIDGEISDKNQLLNIAIKMSTDVVVLGSYDIKDEKITININAIDILTGQKVIEIKKEGELGVDLLILVDEVAKLMSEEMYKELTMVRKSYYETKLKEQEEILKNVKIESINKAIDLNGNIFILINDLYGIEKNTAYEVTKLFIESIINPEKCKIINNKEKINVLDKFNFNNPKLLLKNQIIKLGNELNVENIIVISINKNEKLIKKVNELIVNMIIFDIKKEKEIHIKENNILNNELENKLVNLLKDKNEHFDQITFFNRGVELSIGGGFSPFYFKEFFTVELFSDNLSTISSERQVYKHNYQWNIYPNLSLLYYSNPYLSIGFNSKIGYAPSIILHWIGSDTVKSTYANNLFFNFSIKNKIGSLNSKIKYLVEYGGQLNVLIPNPNEIELIPNEEYIIIPDVLLDAGLTLLIGFEISHKKFSFELGLLHGFYHGFNYFLYPQMDPRSLNFSFIQGIELRFNYKFKKNYFYKNIILPKHEVAENKIELNNDKYWKRHFFDLCLIGGYSYVYGEVIKNSEGSDSKYQRTHSGSGGLIGLSFGYQYAFNKYFAFGPGMSSIINFIFEKETKIYISGEKAETTSYKEYETKFSVYYSGICFMFQFMFGNLKDNKIAFILDIGGGWLAALKFGFYYKGFVMKIGYHLTCMHYPANETNPVMIEAYGHNFTIDVGYKFNWARKNKKNK